jgi:hypothetical protein
MSALFLSIRRPLLTHQVDAPQVVEDFRMGEVLLRGLFAEFHGYLDVLAEEDPRQSQIGHVDGFLGIQAECILEGHQCSHDVVVSKQ